MSSKYKSKHSKATPQSEHVNGYFQPLSQDFLYCSPQLRHDHSRWVDTAKEKRHA